MKFKATLLSFVICNLAMAVEPAPNGIEIPKDYKNWQLISSSHREDNKTLRVILGNDIAVKAARENKTNPYPEGAILGKLVWKESRHSNWEKAIVPSEFVHVEFMFKDSEKYNQTGGWGFARWKGTELKPYGENANFVQECFGCHTPVKENDYVFTHPSVLP
jgi:hypothetical protein